MFGTWDFEEKLNVCYFELYIFFRLSKDTLIRCLDIVLYSDTYFSICLLQLTIQYDQLSFRERQTGNSH